MYWKGKKKHVKFKAWQHKQFEQWTESCSCFAEARQVMFTFTGHLWRHRFCDGEVWCGICCREHGTWQRSCFLCLWAFHKTHQTGVWKGMSALARYCFSSSAYNFHQGEAIKHHWTNFLKVWITCVVYQTMNNQSIGKKSLNLFEFHIWEKMRPVLQCRWWVLCRIWKISV